MDKNLFGAGNGNNGFGPNGQKRVQNGANNASSSFAPNGQGNASRVAANNGSVPQGRVSNGNPNFVQRPAQMNGQQPSRPVGQNPYMQNTPPRPAGQGGGGSNMPNSPMGQNGNAPNRPQMPTGQNNPNRPQMPNGQIMQGAGQRQNISPQFSQGQMQRPNAPQNLQGQNINANRFGVQNGQPMGNQNAQGGVQQNGQGNDVGSKTVESAVGDKAKEKAGVLLNGKGPKKKKMTVIISSIVAGVLLLSLGLGILFGGKKKTFDVQFVTGPFEPVATKTYTEGEVVVAEGLEDVVSVRYDGSTQLLAKFEGWYLDEERTQPYSPFVLKDNITLYAGYTLGDVTTKFYAQNDFDGDGSNLFLFETTTKYWGEQINLSTVSEKISDLDCEYYDDLSLVSKIDITTGQVEQASSDISKADYIQFIHNYYELVSFGGEGNRLSLNSQIDTPAGDSCLVANYSAKNVEIRLHTNKNSKNKYFASHPVSEDVVEYQDEVAVVARKYGTEYVLPTYPALAGMSTITDKESLKNHDLVGWTSVDPMVENGEPTNPVFGKDYISIGSAGNGKVSISKEFLKNQQSIDLYAVWEECATELKIYTSGINGTQLATVGSVSNGYSQKVSEWADVSNLNREQDGYILVGLKTQDGIVLEQGLDTLLVGGSDSIGYVAEENAIILYAYYKKFARQTLISVVDVGLSSDIASINEEDLKESFNFNFENLEGEGFHYDESRIDVYFDSDSRQIVITNLIEGTKFNLPTESVLYRTNYNLNGFRFAGEIISQGEQIEISAGNISLGTGVVTLVAVWQGKMTQVPIGLDYNEVSDSWEEEVIQIEYGSSMAMLCNTTKNGAITSISFNFYSNGQSILLNKIEKTKEGFDFVGWTNRNGELYQDSDLQNIIINSNFGGLCAKWQVYTYNVTFALAGGNVDGDESAISLVAKHGEEVSLQLGQVKEGYLFDGWTSDSVTYNYDQQNFVATKDITLIAKWVKQKSVTLYAEATKMLESSTKIYSDRAGDIVINGSELSQIMSGVAGFGDDVRFNAFNTMADGSGLRVEAKEEKQSYIDLFGSQENVDLFAVWFVINFSGSKSGENYNIAGSVPATRELTYGATVTLPTKEEISLYSDKKIYQFDGWRVAGNGGESKVQTLVANEANTSYAFTKDNIGKTISAVADWKLRDVRLEVYDDNNVRVFQKTLAYNSTDRLVQITSLPQKASHQLDYLRSKDNYAYFDVSGSFVVEVPQLVENYSISFNEILIDSVKAEYEFVYKLTPVWKYTVVVYENIGSDSDTVYEYVGADHSSADSNGKIAISQVGNNLFTLKSGDEYGFSCTHKTFSRWSTNSAGTDNVSGIIILEGDITYYAIWVGAEIVVKYVDNMGSNTHSDMVVAYGDSFTFDATAYNQREVSKVENGEKTYWVLKSFVYSYGDKTYSIEFDKNIVLLSNANGGIFDEEDLNNGEVTINALWAVKTYNLQVELEGGTWDNSKASKSLSSYGFDYGIQNTLVRPVTYAEVKAGIEIMSASGYVREGYRFAQYKTKTLTGNGNVAYDSSNDTYTYSYSGTVDEFNANQDGLSIVWQEIFSIRFDLNGGSFVGDENAFVTLSKDVTKTANTMQDYASNFEIPYRRFAREGATFVGWWFEQDPTELKEASENFATWWGTYGESSGSGERTTEFLTTGDKFSLCREDVQRYLTSSNTVTLYAIWKSTITFSADRLPQGVNIKSLSYPDGEITIPEDASITSNWKPTMQLRRNSRLFTIFIQLDREQLCL